MNITEVRIFPTKSKDGRLKAYATMTFDDWFVIRNVKIIQGNSSLFVAMPSRKAMDPCPRCGFKNVRGSKFCNDCGSGMSRPQGAHDDPKKRQSEHMDIAHPIKQECRVYIQDKILDSFKKEMDRKEREGESYRPASEEDLDAASRKFSEPEHHMKKPVHHEARPFEARSSAEQGEDIEL
jgi:stage V sporulation protein G